MSASAICLGLRNRCSLAEKERAKQARRDAHWDASELVRSFTERFGTIVCCDLIGLGFSHPDEYRKFQESGIWKEKCDKYVQFVIDKLYEFDEKEKLPAYRSLYELIRVQSDPPPKSIMGIRPTTRFPLATVWT